MSCSILPLASCRSTHFRTRLRFRLGKRPPVTVYVHAVYIVAPVPSRNAIRVHQRDDGQFEAIAELPRQFRVGQDVLDEGLHRDGAGDFRRVLAADQQDEFRTVRRLGEIEWAAPGHSFRPGWSQQPGGIPAVDPLAVECLARTSCPAIQTLAWSSCK